MTVGRTRVGLFGLLGSGNIGNDASMESMLRYLRSDHPDAIVDAMCTGPEQVEARYGMRTVALSWYQRYEQRATGVKAIVLKAAGKGLDTFRIASWVRRHDVVIVPGMGVLESTLPLRALGTPLALFLVCASGRLFRTKVALVSVGANVTKHHLTQWLYRATSRLAFYCSYRDFISREAMRPPRGDTMLGEVYPDLAFAIPVPIDSGGDPDLVGVGVMEFYGSNDERQQASEIYESYVQKLKAFILWLVDSGRSVRLFVGDTNGCDDAVIGRIQAELRADRPGLPSTQVSAAEVLTFDDLVAAMEPVGAVIATRYHNVICAVRLCKPTISIGYAAKHDAVMADMGLADYCQRAGTLDVDRLIEQFTELQARASELRPQLADRNAALARQLSAQFEALSLLLFPATAQSDRWLDMRRPASGVTSRASR